MFKLGIAMVIFGFVVLFMFGGYIPKPDFVTPSKSDSFKSSIIKVRFDEDGVLCYIYDNGYGSGISCVSVK